MFANLGTHFLGAVIFLFILWKKLKADASAETIFSLGFLVIFAILASLKYFWLLVILVIAVSALCIRKFKMRFNEVFDALVIALLPWISIVFLKNSVTSSSLSEFIKFIVVLILICLYYLIDTNYKRFIWYRSGKIGLAGGVTLLLLIIFYCVMLFI